MITYTLLPMNEPVSCPDDLSIRRLAKAIPYVKEVRRGETVVYRRVHEVIFRGGRGRAKEPLLRDFDLVAWMEAQGG